MANQTEILTEAMRTIDELFQHTPESDDFDHGFGLDFSLGVFTWIEVAPQVIQYISNRAEVAEGAKRGHMLGLLFVAARPDVYQELREQGREALIQQIHKAVRDSFPRFRQYLQDSHRLVRYWAIWGIWMSAMPDTKTILASRAAHEPWRENRDVILSLIDPNWQPTRVATQPVDDLPF